MVAMASMAPWSAPEGGGVLGIPEQGTHEIAMVGPGYGAKFRDWIRRETCKIPGCERVVLKATRRKG